MIDELIKNKRDLEMEQGARKGFAQSSVIHKSEVVMIKSVYGYRVCLYIIVLCYI